MNTKKILISSFFTLLTVFFSCSKAKNNKVFFLTNNDVKYWDMYDPIFGYAYAYGFKKDGTCIYYFYNNYDELTVFNYDDEIVSNKWEFKGDSLIINDTSRKILILNQDSIVLERTNQEKLYYPRRGNTMILVVNGRALSGNVPNQDTVPKEGNVPKELVE